MTKEKKEESKLQKLKEKYKDLKKEYNLPEFDELNKEFSIEKISDVETDFLMREIGRVMSDKFSSYLRITEMMLNPINSPIFVFSMVKAMGEDEKKKLSEAYKELTKIELNLIELDVNFSMKKQAEFIINSYKSWKEIKGYFSEVISKVKSKWDSKHENNNKAYFG